MAETSPDHEFPPAAAPAVLVGSDPHEMEVARRSAGGRRRVAVMVGEPGDAGVAAAAAAMAEELFGPSGAVEHVVGRSAHG